MRERHRRPGHECELVVELAFQLVQREQLVLQLPFQLFELVQLAFQLVQQLVQLAFQQLVFQLEVVLLLQFEQLFELPERSRPRLEVLIVTRGGGLNGPSPGFSLD